jgi:hypothetical protein
MSTRFRDLGVSGAVEWKVFADDGGGYGVRFVHNGRDYFLGPNQDDVVEDSEDAASFGTRDAAAVAARHWLTVRPPASDVD